LELVQPEPVQDPLLAVPDLLDEVVVELDEALVLLDEALDLLGRLRVDRLQDRLACVLVVLQEVERGPVLEHVREDAALLLDVDLLRGLLVGRRRHLPRLRRLRGSPLRRGLRSRLRRCVRGREQEGEDGREREARTDCVLEDHGRFLAGLARGLGARNTGTPRTWIIGRGSARRRTFSVLHRTEEIGPISPATVTTTVTRRRSGLASNREDLSRRLGGIRVRPTGRETHPPRRSPKGNTPS